MTRGAAWPSSVLVEPIGVGRPGYISLPLEGRHPFFDVRLLIFALSVPPIPWMVNKALLRAAMRGRLPERIRLRPKTPLGAMPAAAGPPPPVDWPSRLAATPELEPFVNIGHAEAEYRGDGYIGAAGYGDCERAAGAGLLAARPESVIWQFVCQWYNPALPGRLDGTGWRRIPPS